MIEASKDRHNYLLEQKETLEDYLLRDIHNEDDLMTGIAWAVASLLFAAVCALIIIVLLAVR